MIITGLAGGVGGAKLANGLSQLLAADKLCVVVNTADDFEYLGLYICPDIDTVTYNLAGINDPYTGWGLHGDTYAVLDAIEKFGHPKWFKLGDRDFATHIERTMLLRSGQTLSQITLKIAENLGVKHCILPMTNDPVRTEIITENEEKVPFQEYFVRLQSNPVVKRIVFDGIEKSSLPDIVASKLESSDVVIICPSNPFVSIDPILSVPGFSSILKNKTVIAVSPLIGGKTIKGPAAKMMKELGLEPSSLNIAQHYQSLISGIVIDLRDEHEKEAISHCGIIPMVTDIYMPDVDSQVNLAKRVIDFGIDLLKGKRQ
jgi:LPPG:FO 2-phospho-L-lactate transferase